MRQHGPLHLFALRLRDTCFERTPLPRLGHMFVGHGAERFTRDEARLRPA
jgi:hypothetical protein